jgi:hypothetical protein
LIGGARQAARIDLARQIGPGGSQFECIEAAVRPGVSRSSRHLDGPFGPADTASGDKSRDRRSMLRPLQARTNVA